MVKTPTGIPTDPPLTSKGVEQSRELAEYLCSIVPPVDRVYSSPFYRCLQTLKPTTDRLFREGSAKGKIRIDRGVGYVEAQLWSFHMRACWSIADAVA
jgi:transcription factor C subunit 7